MGLRGYDVPQPATQAAEEPRRDGIRLVITSDQLRKHCFTRAEHHQARARWYETEAGKLKGSVEAAQEETEALEDAGLVSAYQKAESPLRGLKSSARMHRARSAWFKTVAAHVEPERQFTLLLHEIERFDLAEAFQ